MTRATGKSPRQARLRVQQVCDVLAQIAPPELAAEWDNVGLLIGDPARPVRRALLTIDLTAAVLAEARRQRAEMVLAYHPPIFRPLNRLTPQEAPVVYEAARSGLAVYSMHTALDAAPGGTNDVLAEVVGIVQPRPLEPSVQSGYRKLTVFVPPGDLDRVAEAAFQAGAGRIGSYDRCSFYTRGLGTFRGGPGSRPRLGRAGRFERAEEFRLEVIVPASRLEEVVSAVRAAHSYETPAVDIYPLEQRPAGTGQGRIGPLARPAGLTAIVARLKRALGLRGLLIAGRRRGRYASAACCAGSCGSLFRAAGRAGAELYVTGEMRHHDALAAVAAGLTVICTGHSNSERITLSRLAGRLRRALPGLTVRVSRADRDPFEVI